MKLSPQHSPSGTNSMLNFFTGALDVAYMGSSPLVLGHLYGLPMRLMSVACIHRGSMAIVARSGYAVGPSPRLGTVLGSDGHVLSHFFVKQNDVTSPVYINLAPDECLGGLRSRMIDLAALWEPYVTLAVEGGAQIVFTDADLPFTMYSFIVATERAMEEKLGPIQALNRAHEAALKELREGDGKYISRLRIVFGSEVSARTYEDILGRLYSWEAIPLLEAGAFPESLSQSLENVWDAHQALQGTKFPERPIQDLVRPVSTTKSAPTSDPLQLGYSNSIMCASFHLADYSRKFVEQGFELMTGRQRVEERIARLQPELQEDLRLCYELLHRDPELVVQKLGHMNEQLFRGLAVRLLGEDQKSIAAVIESLRSTPQVPADILSWADSVRSIRNVAAHGDGGITLDEASNVFSIMLNIVEWYFRSTDLLQVKTNRCARCRASVEEDWIACPSCGASLAGVCKSCGNTLEPTWKLCPHCGVSV